MGERRRVVDMVVIGAGIAGLVAANRAAEMGCSVLVLEKGDDRYPCNSRLTGGLLHICFKDVMSPPERLKRAILEEVSDDVSPALVDAVAENSERFVRWLRSQGIKMMKASHEEAFRWVLAPPRIMKRGYSWRGRGGDVMLRTLEATLQSRGGGILRGTRAADLLVSDHGIDGVTAIRGAETLHIEAKATVLADGGFQANPEMLAHYISPAPELLFQRNAATGNGDGIRMAQKAGASLVKMDAFYGHVLSRDVFGNADLWPYPVMDRVIAAGIAVDAHGKRFVDEGMGGVFQANGIGRLENPVSAVAVFDDQIWNTTAREFLFPPNPHLRDRNGTIHAAPDLVAVAKSAGLPAAQLVSTVQMYNEAVDRGDTEGLSPPRTSRRYKPAPILKPPFYAVPLCAGITYTMGGIAIDGVGRALDMDDVPIPNLFAAGCIAGGIEGGRSVGYVGGLMLSGVMGLLAGEEAARRIGGRG